MKTLQCCPTVITEGSFRQFFHSETSLFQYSLIQYHPQSVCNLSDIPLESMALWIQNKSPICGFTGDTITPSPIIPLKMLLVANADERLTDVSNGQRDEQTCCTAWCIYEYGKERESLFSCFLFFCIINLNPAFVEPSFDCLQFFLIFVFFWLF